jgi:hypothetical protein
VLAMSAMVATFAAQLAMGDSWRAGVDPDERTMLVTSGPFRVVRNPILTAVLITCAGLTLMAPTAIGLVGFAAVVVANQLLVRLVEEPYLRRVHGQEYLRNAANDNGVLRPDLDDEILAGCCVTHAGAGAAPSDPRATRQGVTTMDGVALRDLADEVERRGSPWTTPSTRSPGACPDT